MKKVKLTSNTQVMAQTMRNAFSRSSTVLGELCQNAKRAGATKIQIQVTPQGRVAITDDGSGIEDFDSLLCMAASGWDEKVMQEDKPFGLGFMSALYASSHIEVHSKGKRFATDTESFLAGEEVELQESQVTTGTAIIMHLNDSQPINAVCPNIRVIAMGFPVPIYLNHELLPSPYALVEDDNDVLVTEYGSVMFPAIHPRTDVEKASQSNNPLGDKQPIFALSSEVIMYLQGLPIKAPASDDMAVLSGVDTSYYSASATVIHLDSKHFTARVPDREQLVIADSDELLPITASIREAMMQVIKADKARLTDEEFIVRWWDTCHSFPSTKLHNDATALFNDIYVVPMHLLRELESIVDIGIGDIATIPAEFPELTGEVLTREQAEALQLFQIDNLVDMEYSEGNSCLAPAYAYVANAPDTYIFNMRTRGGGYSYGLNAGHWLKPITIEADDAGEFSLNVHGEDASVHTVPESACSIGMEIVLCDHFTLSYKGGDATAPIRKTLMANDLTCYIPNLDRTPEDALIQVTQFEIDGYYDAGYKDSTTAELAHYIWGIRNPDNPAGLLEQGLEGLSTIQHPSLEGKSFTIHISRGKPSVIAI